MDRLPLVEVAVAAANEAARTLQARYGRGDLDIQAKTSVTDLVTDADLAAEQVIVNLIERHRPGDGFTGEEGHAHTSKTGVHWVVDPLDGTANFVSGIPPWAVSIAARGPTGVLAAAIAVPPLGEIFAREIGGTLTLNTAPLRERGRSSRMDQAVGVGGWKSGSMSGGVVSIVERVGRFRVPGSPAAGLAWLAAGRADFAYYEQDLWDWDITAGLFLCEQSGLTVHVELDGGRASKLLVARPALFDQLFAVACC